jgi:hypothetical protein
MLIFAFLATLHFVSVHGHLLAELRSLGALLLLAAATPALRTLSNILCLSGAILHNAVRLGALRTGVVLHRNCIRQKSRTESLIIEPAMNWAGSKSQKYNFTLVMGQRRQPAALTYKMNSACRQ